jgi:hypothetical protein
LITLNPSTLTFFLDRLSSNLVKMIKIGTTIRTRNVIITLLSFALGAPSQQQDRYLARRPYFPTFLGPASNGRAIELEADLGFRHD